MILRQPIVVDYAEDRTLCRSLIHEITDPDDNYKSHYFLSLPPGVTDSLLDDDPPPGQPPGHYRRGRFDFDNDGITDLVYAVTESNRFFNGDRYFIFPNTPKPRADLPEEEQPSYEPWPDDFGLEWLVNESRYAFPDMWVIAAVIVSIVCAISIKAMTLIHCGTRRARTQQGMNSRRYILGHFVFEA